MNFQEMLADIESSITGAIATITAMEPAVNAVVMAVNPGAGASLVAGEAVVNEVVTLAQPVVAALQTVTTTTTSTTPATPAAPVADSASVAALGVAQAAASPDALAQRVAAIEQAVLALLPAMSAIGKHFNL